jgi:hypothetical protein
LWHKKGQNVGQLPTSTVDRGDDIEVSGISMILCSCIMPNNHAFATLIGDLSAFSENVTCLSINVIKSANRR